METIERPRGWNFLRRNVAAVLELGRIEAGTKIHCIDSSEGPRQQDAVDTIRDDASTIYSAIPFVPKYAAILCLLFNILLSGSGTCLSGLMLLCCGQPRIGFKSSRIAWTIFVNLAVGLAQFITVPLLCVGWVWSVAWGAILVRRAGEYDVLKMKHLESVGTAVVKRTLCRPMSPKGASLPNALDAEEPKQRSERIFSRRPIEILKRKETTQIDSMRNSRIKESKGWEFVRKNIQRVLQFGRSEGRTKIRRLQRHQTSERKSQIEEDTKHVKIGTNDVGIIRTAIPLLPMRSAVICLLLNVFVPGTGTCLSGFLVPCGGQSRIRLNDSRITMTILVNIFVGVAQFFTLFFLCVGWAWSIAWGALLYRHASQYKQAMKKIRREKAATSAVRAFARDIVLRPKDIRELVNEKRAASVGNLKKSKTKIPFRPVT